MSNPILYLAWQDPQSRRWFTIGRLRKLPAGSYEFVYVKGFNTAQKTASMEPLIGFLDTTLRYVSDTLFPFFKNRLMSPNREDYPAYIRKLGFDEAPQEPLEILARSEGQRVTDSFQFQLFPAPSQTIANGQTIWTFDFFIHGMRHVQPDVQKLQIEAGTVLSLLWDFQNTHDPNALMLRTATCHLVGWVPRFYCADILALRQLGHDMRVSVLRTNNEPVPSWFRVMCRLTARSSEAFHPCATDEFQPIPPQAEL